MKRNSGWRLAGFVVLCGLLAPGASALAAPTSLAACLRLATDNWHLLKAAKHESAAGQAERNAVRGHFLPQLRLESSLMFWDQRRDMMDVKNDLAPLLGQVGTVLNDLSPHLEAQLTSDAARQAYKNLSGAMQGLGSAEGQNKLQDQLLTHKKVTWTNTLSVAQPLTQLYAISSGYKARDEQLRSRREDERSAAHDVELTVVRSYYGLIAAARAQETTAAAIKQVEAIEKQVQSLLDQGLVERNALMKVQVQKAELRKTLFSVRMNEKLARAALNMLMGRALDAALDPEPQPLDEQAGADTASMDLGAQTELALKARPDLLSADHLQNAARYGRHAAIGAMLPELSAVFLYENKHGLGSMASPKNQYYGGLNLTWTFWEWGAEYYKVVAAQETEAKARESLLALRDAISLDVETKRLALEEAQEVLAVTRTARLEARENLRIEASRYGRAANHHGRSLAGPNPGRAGRKQRHRG